MLVCLMKEHDCLRIPGIFVYDDKNDITKSLPNLLNKFDSEFQK